MSRRKWATVSRYRDGLITPEARAIAVDRGITWVTDRFVLARTDMFSISVTERGWLAGSIKPHLIRRVLDKRPVVGDAIYGNQAGIHPKLVGDGEQSALLIKDFGGYTASVFNPSISPLLDACDLLRLKDGSVYGYQRRPHSAAPVLVAVVHSIRWSSHLLKEVES